MLLIPKYAEQVEADGIAIYSCQSVRIQVFWLGLDRSEKRNGVMDL